MSAGLPAQIAKLIPRLGSDQDGEVVATARAIDRTLRSAGFDWHSLAEVVTAPIAAVPIVTSTMPVAWPKQAQWCRANDFGRLSDAERRFVADMAARAWSEHVWHPSLKQASWLDGIFNKLRAGS